MDASRYSTGQNVFVAAFGAGLVLVPEHHIYGSVLMLLGIGGFIYSFWSSPMKPDSYLWLAAILLTWAGLAYDYYDCHFGTAPAAIVQPGRVVKGWGSTGDSCNELIDGSQLMQWANNYQVVVFCGLADATIDRFEDQRITISAAFSIHPGELSIAVPYSQGTLALRDDFMERVRKSLPPGTKQVQMQATQWYEVCLIPKTVNPMDLHKLSDVPRYGGNILSQGFPKP